MRELRIIDYLFLYSLTSIWLLLLYNVFLTFYGYLYHREISRNEINILRDMSYFPRVSILIPAHNEEKVIEKTLWAVLRLNYPEDKIQIIVINDLSSDLTGKIVERIRLENEHRDFRVIHTNKENGGKGKPNALNIGFRYASGEYIVVYDADNTPESLSLRYLVNEIILHPKYGAVIGKFRTRNKERNLLTRFINIETINFQWMSQGGRWKLFGLCTIPGTNYIIHRDILHEIGGWDAEAIAEDTEISIRIYQLGYKIAFMPLAVTWEQEPESFSVWRKQRLRWVKGNIYVVHKYILSPISSKYKRIKLDIYYFFMVYFLFLSSIFISDGIFLLGIFTDIRVSLPGYFLIIWILAYILFILEVEISVAMEKGEAHTKNLGIIMLMYFTYCQLWLYISLLGLGSYIKDIFLKREQQWYKTERF
ncbi:MAG: glycosyltransferase family 2 protein [Bacillota bacterium]